MEYGLFYLLFCIFYKNLILEIKYIFY